MLLSACASSKDLNPKLDIGSYPKPPAKQKYPKLVVGKIHLEEDKNKKFNTKGYTNLTREMLELKSNETENITTAQALSDWFSLMSPGGAVLTIWALAEGNWLWGYTLIDSIGFSGARIWRFHFFENNEVMLENGGTGTCASAYKNGLVHLTCNEDNPSQRFELVTMDNGAFMLKNPASNKCVQAPIGDIFGDFHKVSDIYLTTCASSRTLDQQWYVVAPPFLLRPLYDKNDK